jgi:hypothetical protein
MSAPVTLRAARERDVPMLLALINGYALVDCAACPRNTCGDEVAMVRRVSLSPAATAGFTSAGAFE